MRFYSNIVIQLQTFQMRFSLYTVLLSLTIPYYISAQNAPNNRQQETERNLHIHAFITGDESAASYTLTERMRERKLKYYGLETHRLVEGLKPVECGLEAH